MAAPTIAGLPPDLALGGGYTLRVTALDPTTGAVVSGVNVQAVAITAKAPSATPADLAVGPFKLVSGPDS